MSGEAEPLRKRKLAAALQLVGTGAPRECREAADVAMPMAWTASDAASRRVDVDITKTLQSIVDYQLLGLRRAHKLDDAGARAAVDRLRAHKCSPEDIAEQVAAELARALGQRSDAPHAASTRLGGYGWSHQHIEEHMKRYLEGRVSRMMSGLRSEAMPHEPHARGWTEALEKTHARALISGTSMV